MSLKSILRKIFNSKVVDLDNDGKIETLREEIQGVFSQFVTMHEQLDKVNGQLDGIVEDEQKKQKEERARLERIIVETNRKLAESDERVSKVQNEIQGNKKLQEKVSEFLPNKG